MKILWKEAIDRLRYFEPPEGYYLAFSGGKDSIVIKELAKLSGVFFESWYSVTTIDPPELVRFIRQYHPDVNWLKPEIPFLRKLSTKGFPLRQKRWCCEFYKENGGNNRRIITGVRWKESYNRRSRKVFEHCFSGGYKSKGKTFVNPIIDWTDEDVWSFIRENNLPYCSLYDQGWKRIGCLFCPMAPRKHRLIEAQEYPRYVALFIRAFEKLYALRKSQERKAVDRWSSGEEMFWWWLDESGKLTDADKHRIKTMIFE